MKRMLAVLILCCLVLPLRASNGDEADPPFAQTDGVVAAALVEPITVTRLWAKEPDAKHTVAGLSRLPAILTLATVFDEGALTEGQTMRVSARAAAIGGPTAFVEGGEEIAAGELMKAAVMISAGDAILALGENAFGSEQVFVDNINVSLKKLGLSVSLTDALGTNACFSAWDLAMLGRAAASSETLMKYAGRYMDSIVHSDGRETELVSANRLIKSFSGCKGLMTGSSQTDGYCGVFLAQRGETTLLAVIIGAKDAPSRSAAATALLEYGLSNFRAETLASPDRPVKEGVALRGGKQREIDLYVKEKVVVVREANAGETTREFDLPPYLDAPLDPKERVGTLQFQNAAGETLAETELYVRESVEAFGIKELFFRVVRAFLSYS